MPKKIFGILLRRLLIPLSRWSEHLVNRLYTWGRQACVFLQPAEVSLSKLLLELSQLLLEKNK